MSPYQGKLEVLEMLLLILVWDEVIIEEEIYYTDGTGYSDDNSDVPSEDGV